MIRLLLAGVVALTLIAGFQTYRLRGAQHEAATLAADLATAQAINEANAEAAIVHRAHIERLELAEQQWDALERDLQSIGGRDAPLSDNLAAAARRLWP
ncbi:hypothetical protein [Cypionkella sp.]|uniref:hypothetical protein n=1 Tax=Cypionkella sp. TaxID=2811411 RepID=UPI002AB9D60C|nr:hypothetical protein [Cypionkella sp.]MDZ4392500.1 hypothetical protein [Cypionkella sp.]